MSHSNTLLDTISSGQSSKEVTANELFDAGSPATLFGRRASTTSGLTWGYYGGVVSVGGALELLANGTVTLTNNAVNYLVYDDSASPTGVVVGTGSWPSGVRLYAITVSGGAVTEYFDWRAGASAGGGGTGATPVVAGFFFPGTPAATQLFGVFAAPDGIALITYAAAIAGSSGKALTAATAQYDIDVRKNATTAVGGSSVGTIRFAAAGTVPTFIAASGFSLIGGTDYLSLWGQATPDATLADISVSLYGER